MQLSSGQTQPEQSASPERCDHSSPLNYDQTRFKECDRPKGHKGNHETRDGFEWTDRTMPCRKA